MKKQKNKQGIKASKLAKAENRLKKQAEQIITVKNAEGDPDTEAKILIQNKINYIPKVSVIIPVYNVEEYLRECLDSVVNQTLKEIEIICVDDGSTDSSLEILKEYAKNDNRISVLTQENSGSGKSRNNGINNAKGEFIAFMDSDDFYPSHNTLENMYTKACKYNVNICGGSLNQLKEGKIITDPKLFEEGYTFKKEGVINYQDYQFDYGYWRFIYKRQFLRENQLYFPDYLRCQDPPFFIKAMAISQQFYALREATYVYRVSHKNIQWTERKAQDVAKGLMDCLNLAETQNYDELYFRLSKRVINPYISNIFKLFIEEDDTKRLLCRMINNLNYQKIYMINPNYQLPDLYQKFLETKKVSIIIPVYNTAPYLRECLDSVINQSLKEIEIICVNDGSTDNSLDILEEYAAKDKRIIIINQENQGLSCTRNNALKIAKGEYIQFVDSDDLIKDDTCEKLYNKMSENNLDMLSFSGYNFRTSRENREENKYWSFEWASLLNGKDIFSYKDCKNFMHKMAVSSCLTIYKRELIKKNNLYFPPHLCYEDNVFFLKALTKAERVSIDKNEYYIRRIHSGSITQNLNKNFADYINISDLVLSYLMKLDTSVYNIYRKAYIGRCISIYQIQDKRSQKKYKKSLKMLIKKHDNNSRYLLASKSYTKAYVQFIFNQLNRGKDIRNLIQLELKASRIDIKNFGNENNVVQITTSAKVLKPAWFINAQGIGQVVETNKKIENISIKAIQNGKLRLDFRGQDKRFEGTRFPVWIDYKSIKIDGKEILSAPIATWHDKPFRYEMPVKDGQIVKVDLVQQYHQYSKDELKDVILKLNPNSDYIKENIEKLTNKIYKKITVNKTTVKSSPQTTLFAKVKQNLQKYVNLWHDKFSFARKIEPVIDLMQKNQAQILRLLQDIQAKNTNLENKNNELKKEIEVLKGTFNTQLSDFKKQQEERSKQLMAIGDRLSTELQRATNELQNAEQSQTSEIKATLSEFIAQLAATENKLSAELQRATNELQSTEQSQASEIKATLSEFIAQLAVTENKLSTELQRTTAELQSAEQSQASEIKATLSEFIAQLAVTENKLSAELQRATNELQSTEQSQASEIKATLSDFIAQLAATENKLSAEFQRMTTELQNAEKSQASEIKATLSDFIAQLAATENKLTAELQRATEKLQNSGISEISEIKTYCADFAQYLDNAQAKMLSELNNQRETALQNKNNIIAGINQTEQSLQMQASKSHELVQEQMAILDRVQERLEDLSALKEIDFAQKSELDVLSQDIEKQKSELLEKVQNLQNKAQLQYQELNFADLLHDSTHSSSWLKDKNFALYGWAANYSFIYTLFRILDNVQPAHILEMGLGQTSMVTTQYIANKKPAADLDIIENDESWIKVYEPKLAKSQNIKLHQCDIEFFDYEGEQSRKYKELNKITGDKKYNLIIVDGPFGGAQKLPRSNIVELVEHNLAQDFIIMFDDAERAGEQNTIAQTKAKLTSLGIKFGTQQRNALKSQVLIFSKSCEFAKYL